MWRAPTAASRGLIRFRVNNYGFIQEIDVIVIGRTTFD